LLIDSHLATPSTWNHDDDKEMDSELDKETTQANLSKNTCNNIDCHTAFLTMHCHQQKLPVSAMHLDSSKCTTAVAMQGSEMLIILQQEHMNGVPATCNNLEQSNMFLQLANNLWQMLWQKFVPSFPTHCSSQQKFIHNQVMPTKLLEFASTIVTFIYLV